MINELKQLCQERRKANPRVKGIASIKGHVRVYRYGFDVGYELATDHFAEQVEEIVSRQPDDDVELLVPPGWSFYTADFSCRAAQGPHGPNGFVQLSRDREQRLIWHSVGEHCDYDDAVMGAIPLYVEGRGKTFLEALHSAADKARNLPPIQAPEICHD